MTIRYEFECLSLIIDIFQKSVNDSSEKNINPTVAYLKRGEH